MVNGSTQGQPLERYEVLEYLSEGGMGAIYIGRKLGAGGFGREVVLKQLLPEFTSQPEFIDLFKNEARLSCTLEHANIIKTIDLVTAGDDHFIVMEYLRGADLRILLKRIKRRRQRLSPAAAIYITCEVLSALAYAHSKRSQDGQPLDLIHRDISPSNVLVSHNGEVKLTDFGIAKASTNNSVFYRVKGKVGYMSPEQARSEDLDHRSDLYSLAVCLYEMITGERLFVSAGLTTSAEEMYNQPVPLVSRKVRGVPAELDKVMLKALARDPDHRYQSAGAFREALLRCAHRAGMLMSAPELAQHLREICGSPGQWREPVNAEPRAASATAGLGSVEGTEVYDNFEEGTLELDASEVDWDEWAAVYGSDAPPVDELERERSQRVFTSITKLSSLRGVELTSMIHLDEIAARQRERDASAHPGMNAVGYDDPMTVDGAQAIDPYRDLSGPDSAAPAGHRSDSVAETIARADARSLQPGTGEPLSSPMAEPFSGSSPPAPVDTPTPAPTGGSLDTLHGNESFDLDMESIEESPPDLSASKSRRRSRAWIVFIFILIMGIAAAAAVGLSGPKLGKDRSGKEPADPSGPTGASDPATTDDDSGKKSPPTKPAAGTDTDGKSPKPNGSAKEARPQ